MDSARGWIGVEGLLLSGEVEERREVASLEVVGGCRFIPFIAAVQVGDVFSARRIR